MMANAINLPCRVASAIGMLRQKKFFNLDFTGSSPKVEPIGQAGRPNGLTGGRQAVSA